MLTMSIEEEADRLDAVYARRYRRELTLGFEGFSHALRLHCRYLDLFRLLARHGLGSLADLDVLDAGSGQGDFLLTLLHWGVDPKRLVAVEARRDAAEFSKTRLPHIRTEIADLRNMGFDGPCFDLVFVNTVFSSILDDEIRRQVSSEILSVVRPGGRVVIYDMSIRNPRNPDVKPVKVADIKKMFGDTRVESTRLSLAPPIGRLLVGPLWRLSLLLEALVPLRSHRLSVVTK
jgi:SAM-dependent methyltransferase